MFKVPKDSLEGNREGKRKKIEGETGLGNETGRLMSRREGGFSERSRQHMVRFLKKPFKHEGHCPVDREEKNFKSPESKLSRGPLGALRSTGIMGGKGVLGWGELVTFTEKTGRDFGVQGVHSKGEKKWRHTMRVLKGVKRNA